MKYFLKIILFIFISVFLLSTSIYAKEIAKNNLPSASLKELKRFTTKFEGFTGTDGDKLYPMSTNFWKKGLSIFGDYQYDYFGKIGTGYLFLKNSFSDNKFEFEWIQNDGVADGKGRAFFIFNKNFTSFDGKWTWDGTSDKGPWSGSLISIDKKNVFIHHKSSTIKP